MYMARNSWSLHLFGKTTAPVKVKENSLVELLFEDLTLYPPQKQVIQLRSPTHYVYTEKKEGRFLGLDIIFIKGFFFFLIF